MSCSMQLTAKSKHLFAKFTFLRACIIAYEGRVYEHAGEGCCVATIISLWTYQFLTYYSLLIYLPELLEALNIGSKNVLKACT